MKPERLMVFVCVLGMLLCLIGAARADSLTQELERHDAWTRIPEDKRTHAIVEARIGLLFGSFVFAAPSGAAPEWTRLATASAMCLSFGVGKEALDEIEYRAHTGRPTGADPLDLVADAAGCAAGIGAGAALGTGARITAGAIAGASGGSFTASVRF